MISDGRPPENPEAETASAQRKPRRTLALVAIVVVLLAIIAGSIWAATRSPSGATVATHATPTATATKASTPHVVYQSDWSHGVDGWKLPAGAKISDGHLVLDSSGSMEVEIPYVPKTRNYTIDMDFQVVYAPAGSHFGLTARNAAGEREYLSQMECTPMHQGAWNPALGGCAGAVTVYAKGGTYPSGLFTSDYVIHGGPQTLALELKGDTVTFCPVNDCLVPVSGKPMDTAPHLIIDDRAVKLVVTRVTITEFS